MINEHKVYSCKIRDRILALGDLYSIRQQLNAHHRFTHNVSFIFPLPNKCFNEVHQALHEVIFDEEKVRYLIAILLFTRAKATEQIHLDKCLLLVYIFQILHHNHA